MGKQSTVLGLLLILFLLYGIFLRGFALDQKVYWHDEVFTALRSAGYIGETVVEEVFTGEIMTPSQLLKYQKVTPEKPFDDTLESLMTHPEHPPIYYILVRVWQDGFGSSIATIRSLSVVFSYFIFPALYLFCYAVFQSHSVAITSIFLLAVSPFHLLYAQEARPYSFWTLTTLLWLWSFWQVVQKKQWQYWLIYGTITVLNFYTSLLSSLVAFTQGVYLVLQEKRLSSRTIRNYFLVMFSSAIAFSPWLLIIINNYSQLRSKTGWTTEDAPYSFLVKIWGLHFSSLLIDLGFSIDHPYSYLIPPLILILIAYGFWFLKQTSTRSRFLFLLCLFLIPSLSLILPDLIFGGQRSVQTRYFIPSLIAVQVTLGYLFSQKLKQRVWQVLLVIILSVGLISCWQISQAEVWWNKGISYSNPQAAKVINQSSDVLVISNAGGNNLGNIISLAYLVKPETRFKLVTEATELNDILVFDTVFLFYPSPDLKTAILDRYPVKIEEIPDVPLLKLSRILAP